MRLLPLYTVLTVVCFPAVVAAIATNAIKTAHKLAARRRQTRALKSERNRRNFAIKAPHPI